MDVPPPAGKSATTAITNHMVRLAREEEVVLWKLWILQSYSWKTRHGLTISGTSKQERLVLISLQTLTRSFIYPFEEQLLTVTFLVTDSNRLLTQSLFFMCIKLPCNT